MWELDYKESWVLKNWCSWIVVLEKTLESPLDCKEIQPVHPKGNQSWIFIGRTHTEAETPILWPPDGEELTHLKRPWCWERLKVGGEEDDRGWAGWMASLTQWTWVWVNSRSWWCMGKPGVLQSIRLQSWTQLSNWTELTELKTLYKVGIYYYVHFTEEDSEVMCPGELMLSNCGAIEDSWESLGLQGSKPVNPKGNQPSIVIGRTEAPILCPSDANSQLIWKQPNAGKDWRQKEKGTVEEKMVR